MSLSSDGEVPRSFRADTMSLHSHQTKYTVVVVGIGGEGRTRARKRRRIDE